MKAWEIMQRSGKEFIRKADGLTIEITEDGTLNWLSGYMHLNTNDEWEEVRKPVTFMEVVENGGLFTVKHKLFHSSNAFDEINLKEFTEELCDEFTHAEIKQILLEGKFYIED